MNHSITSHVCIPVSNVLAYAAGLKYRTGVSELFSLRATLTPSLSPTGQDLASSSYQHTVVLNYVNIFVSGLAGELVAGPHRGP